MIWVGLVIIILTAVAIVRRYEVRLVLFTSGFIMCLLSGAPLRAIAAFQSTIVHGTFVPIITTVMGFAFVLKLTECDTHLVNALAKPMTALNKALIPAAVVLTFIINIFIPSAAGVGAAVGAIIIPLLVAAGIHPAAAASAVLAGTFGSTLNPGNAHIVMVSGIADVDVMYTISRIAPLSIVSMVIGAIALTVVSVIRKENSGYVPARPEDALVQVDVAGFKVNPLKALVPVTPLVFLVIGSPMVGLFPVPLTVPQAMIGGIVLAGLVSLTNAQKVSSAFFDGMGSAFGQVIGIIAAATAFTTGMDLIGVTPALIAAMERSEAIVLIAAPFGPMLITVLAGSGDAVSMAFNNAITPHAAQFGFDTITLGNIVNLAGGIGRSMSPVGGVGIICAALAKVNPIELTKRNAAGMFLATVFLMISLIIF